MFFSIFGLSQDLNKNSLSSCLRSFLLWSPSTYPIARGCDELSAQQSWCNTRSNWKVVPPRTVRTISHSRTCSIFSFHDMILRTSAYCGEPLRLLPALFRVNLLSVPVKNWQEVLKRQISVVTYCRWQKIMYRQICYGYCYRKVLKRAIGLNVGFRYVLHATTGTSQQYLFIRIAHINMYVVGNSHR